MLGTSHVIIIFHDSGVIRKPNVSMHGYFSHVAMALYYYGMLNILSYSVDTYKPYIHVLAGKGKKNSAI